MCIGVTLECRQTESEMIGDGWGCADEAYHDNANVTLLPSDVFKVHNMEATLVDSRGDKLVEHIQRSMDYDDAVVKAL